VSDRLNVSAYWGTRLRYVERHGEDLQRKGFHVEANWRAF